MIGEGPYLQDSFTTISAFPDKLLGEVFFANEEDGVVAGLARISSGILPFRQDRELPREELFGEFLRFYAGRDYGLVAREAKVLHLIGDPVGK